MSQQFCQQNLPSFRAQKLSMKRIRIRQNMLEGRNARVVLSEAITYTTKEREENFGFLPLPILFFLRHCDITILQQR